MKVYMEVQDQLLLNLLSQLLQEIHSLSQGYTCDLSLVTTFPKNRKNR